MSPTGRFHDLPRRIILDVQRHILQQRTHLWWKLGEDVFKLLVEIGALIGGHKRRSGIRRQYDKVAPPRRDKVIAVPVIQIH